MSGKETSRAAGFTRLPEEFHQAAEAYQAQYPYTPIVLPADVRDAGQRVKETARRIEASLRDLQPQD